MLCLWLGCHRDKYWKKFHAIMIEVVIKMRQLKPDKRKNTTDIPLINQDFGLWSKNSTREMQFYFLLSCSHNMYDFLVTDIPFFFFFVCVSVFLFDWRKVSKIKVIGKKKRKLHLQLFCWSWIFKKRQHLPSFHYKVLSK